MMTLCVCCTRFCFNSHFLFYLCQPVVAVGLHGLKPLSVEWTVFSSSLACLSLKAVFHFFSHSLLSRVVSRVPLMFRMGSALLSRFDLVFILLDKPDEVMPQILLRLTYVLHLPVGVAEAVQPYKNFVSAFFIETTHRHCSSHVSVLTGAPFSSPPSLVRKGNCLETVVVIISVCCCY